MTIVETARVELAGSGVLVRDVAESAPWPGTVVRGVDSTPTLHVDADLLVEWPGWAADPNGHVLAPLDVVRTSDGHRIVLPLCSGPLNVVIDDHDRAHRPLPAGACVTIAVSILRGCTEAMTLGATTGQWWLTEDRRPVLALGVGSEHPCDAGGVLLERLADMHAGDLQRALRRAAEACAAGTQEPEGFDGESSEAALFAAADAAPIDGVVFTPALARTLATVQRREPDPPLRRRSRGHVPHDARDPRGEGVVAQIERIVANEMATDALREAHVWLRSAVASVRARRRPRAREERAPRRRRPLVVASVVGVLVLGAGALWPAGEESAANQVAPPSPSSTATATATETATAAPPPAAEEVDVVGAAEALVTAWAQCAGDGENACTTELVEDPQRPLPSGAMLPPPEKRAITLIDDYGGVAVLRVESTDQAPASNQLLVIVEVGRKWLIRDVYDVADQP